MSKGKEKGDGLPDRSKETNYANIKNPDVSGLPKKEQDKIKDLLKVFEERRKKDK